MKRSLWIELCCAGDVEAEVWPVRDRLGTGFEVDLGTGSKASADDERSFKSIYNVFFGCPPERTAAFSRLKCWPGIVNFLREVSSRAAQRRR